MTVPTSKPRPGRRTLVKGAAWSVPAVAIAVPAHAQACSPRNEGCIVDIPGDNNACKFPGQSQGGGAEYTYRAEVCFRNPYDVPITIQVTQPGWAPGLVDWYVLDDDGNPALNPFTLATFGSQNCVWLFWRSSSSTNAPTVIVNYLLNGNAVPTPIALANFPPVQNPRCPNGPLPTTPIIEETAAREDQDLSEDTAVESTTESQGVDRGSDVAPIEGPTVEQQAAEETEQTTDSSESTGGTDQ